MLDEHSVGLNQCVAIAMSYCPHITSVSLIHHVTDECLLYICGLQHLKSLIAGNSPQSMSFSGGLLPVLQARGAGLELLRLYEIPGVDIPTIGYLCPNLKEFNLFQISDSLSLDHSMCDAFKSVDNRVVPFSKLQSLEVRCMTQPSHVDAFTLNMLLNHSTEIHTIRFSKIDALTDEVFQEVRLNFYYKLFLVYYYYK